MADRISPVHTTVVGMKNVRYFAAPKGREGGLPWVSIDDLFSAISMPRKVRLGFKRDLQTSGGWKGVMASLLTPDGRVDIVPNWAAQGFISAAHDIYKSPIEIQIAYNNGLMAAFEKIDPTAGMGGFQKALIFEINEQKPHSK